MSAGNVITPTGVEADIQAARPAFGIPDDLAARYDVRVIETPDSADRRVGLFLAGDRTNPALEIGNERIVARNDDPETVAALVKLAQHNGWDKIDVEGSPEFAKAVWSAATREGLTVNGYEPTFVEQEQMATLRRETAERGEREAAEEAARAALVARSSLEQDRQPAREPQPARADRRDEDGADRRRESGELAELFLHGAGEKVAADPRLSNALQAQTAMEQHIAEVFKGDAGQMAAATLESRQMISDVLRRGLDVSVREPTPVRQIEPIQSPEMER